MTLATVDAPPKRRLRTEAPAPQCTVCGYHRARALPAFPVCVACVEDPDGARARIERKRGQSEARQAVVARAAQTAYEALDPDELPRWAAYKEARARVECGEADPETMARVQAANAAFRSQTAAVPAALRAAHHADECLHWATEEWAADVRRLDVALAQLGLCLEAMEDKETP